MVLCDEGLLEQSVLESQEAHLVRQYHLFAGCKHYVQLSLEVLVNGKGKNIQKIIQGRSYNLYPASSIKSNKTKDMM